MIETLLTSIIVFYAVMAVYNGLMKTFVDGYKRKSFLDNLPGDVVLIIVLISTIFVREMSSGESWVLHICVVLVISSLLSRIFLRKHDTYN